MSLMLNGDDARVNSLIMIGRKQGLFTTGGRGSGSPDMTPQDAATAVLLTLYAGPPTKCHEAVRELSSLPLVQIKVAPNGPREEARVLVTSDMLGSAEIPLPHQFDNVPETPLVALTRIFESNEPPYSLDEVSLFTEPYLTGVSLTVYDLDKETAGSKPCSERDFFEFSATYRSLEPDKRELGRRDNHSFPGEELRSLYNLLHGLTEEDCLHEMEEGVDG